MKSDDREKTGLLWNRKDFIDAFTTPLDLVHFNVKVRETDLDIGARKILVEEALELVRKYRREIEAYTRKVPGFLTSLKPPVLQT